MEIAAIYGRPPARIPLREDGALAYGRGLGQGQGPAMSKTSRTEPGTAIPSRITPAALALWAQAEARKVANDLGAIGIPVLMLKGPDLQMRLYGTPMAYASGDVDVLVPGSHVERARAALGQSGPDGI